MYRTNQHPGASRGLRTGRGRTTNHDSGPAALTIARPRLLSFPLTKTARTTRHLLRSPPVPRSTLLPAPATTSRPSSATFPPSSPSRGPDARVSAAKAKARHSRCVLPLVSHNMSRTLPSRRDDRMRPIFYKWSRKPFYFDYLATLLSTWIALHEFPTNRELFAARSVISSRSYRRSLAAVTFPPPQPSFAAYLRIRFCRG
jgi:hypothetical protein